MLLSVFLDRHNVSTGISLQSNGNELQQNWSCFCFSYVDLLFQFKFHRHNDTVCYKTDSHCWDVMVDIFLISTGKLKYFMTWFFSIDFFKYNIVHTFVHTWLHAPILKQFMNIFNILLNFVPYFFTIFVGTLLSNVVDILIEIGFLFRLHQLSTKISFFS